MVAGDSRFIYKEPATGGRRTAGSGTGPGQPPPLSAACDPTITHGAGERARPLGPRSAAVLSAPSPASPPSPGRVESRKIDLYISESGGGRSGLGRGLPFGGVQQQPAAPRLVFLQQLRDLFVV